MGYGKQYLIQHTDKLFDAACVDAFFHIFSDNEFADFRDDSFETKLWEIVPREKQTFDWETCKNIADFLRRSSTINLLLQADTPSVSLRKQPHLQSTSATIPHRFRKCILAGALHDIGKMAIDNDILEKPDKLTDEEFSKEKPCRIYLSDSVQYQRF